jgi:two-component system nitrate/nitrite response regulator NarL
MSAILSHSSPPNLRPVIRVLLVDDHPTVLWGLEKLIDSAKPAMEVVATATNRGDALAAAVQHQPDIVLVDIALGDDCGLDLLQELQSRCHAKPIIFTGMNDSELRERAVLQGARGVVHKMESADVILKAIEFVHRGELWLDRVAMTRVLDTLRAASEHQSTKSALSGIAALTQKEREVVVAVVEHKGAPSKVIAAALHVSPHTLRNHLATIYSKLDVRNRMALLIYANEYGLHKLRHRT